MVKIPLRRTVIGNRLAEQQPVSAQILFERQLVKLCQIFVYAAEMDILHNLVFIGKRIHKKLFCRIERLLAELFLRKAEIYQPHRIHNVRRIHQAAVL